MYKNWTHATILAIFTLLLSACSASGIWPNLSDKMPDPATRERVIERAAPTVSIEQADETTVTPENAENWVRETTAAIETAQSAYQTARSAYEGQTNQNNADETVLIHMWLEAQLALTRLSQAISQLDQVILSEELKGSGVAARASQAKTRFDTFTVKERQELEQIKPQGM